MNHTVTVQAPWGSVRGRQKENGKAEFLGIPYGRAERFCPPEPVTWAGTRDALTYGPVAVQPNILGEKPKEQEFVILGEENCLNLNVWTADPEPVSPLPVVVYVHGGAFQVGSNQVPARSGDLFMEDDPMVFVSVNYRLGVLGFLQLGEELGEKYRTSGNCGALDVLLAMRWVRENIAAFGGAPENITVLGISAGAKLLGSLLVRPEMQQACRRIVLESGAMQSFRDLTTARRVAEDLEKTAGVESEQELLTMDPRELVMAQAKYCDAPGSTCFFGPVLDERIFCSDWRERWAGGERWQGEALLGSGRRELCRCAEDPDFPGKREDTLRNLFGDQGTLAQRCFDEIEMDGGGQTENWVRILSDFMYRFYTDELARALTEAGDRVWVYSFDRMPACHGMGFGFLMRQIDPPGAVSAGEDRQEALRVADEMRRMVRRFICTGEPESSEVWPEYRGGNKMSFDRGASRVYRPEDTLTGFPERVYQRS